jgi:hypothetical protein
MSIDAKSFDAKPIDAKSINVQVDQAASLTFCRWRRKAKWPVRGIA